MNNFNICLVLLLFSLSFNHGPRFFPLPCPTADASAAVVGGPASPLAVQVSDVNKDYVFLTWQPPSADGASPVDGYYVEKWEWSNSIWIAQLHTT